MSNRALILGLFALSLLGAPESPRAETGGYTFHRLVIWAEAGDPPPRFGQDPETASFTLLLPGPIPESGWEPMEARRFVVRGGAFAAVEPARLLRPRDPDPDWTQRSTSASLDLNRDGVAEIVQTRNVVIPDHRDPDLGAQRVMVEIREGSRILFGDLLEGPKEGPVRVRSVSTPDFTGEGYTDLVLRLEGEGRSGIAFYSQSPLRLAGTATRVIPGFSPTAFRCDRYGVFDLIQSPRSFFSRLPRSARPEDPRCAAGRGAGERDGRVRCRYLFSSPYLGWVSEFQVEFLPDDRILAFELIFPATGSPLSPDQALEFLTPVFGGGYTTQVESEGGQRHHLWTWKDRRSKAQLLGLEKSGKTRAVSLRLERN